jgi:hypothetical protein
MARSANDGWGKTPLKQFLGGHAARPAKKRRAQAKALAAKDQRARITAMRVRGEISHVEMVRLHQILGLADIIPPVPVADAAYLADRARKIAAARMTPPTSAFTGNADDIDDDDDDDDSDDIVPPADSDGVVGVPLPTPDCPGCANVKSGHRKFQKKGDPPTCPHRRHSKGCSTCKGRIPGYKCGRKA